MAEEQKKNEQLKRGLKRRHLQMIAIGGSIGTGLSGCGILRMGRGERGCLRCRNHS